MGSSKKQTVGYHYKYLLHYGICRAPIDAFLEFRGGDRTAWAGRIEESSTISINAPNLWGGEKNEGGIVGDVDLMFGEQTQMPNSWLITNQGPEQSGLRGKFTFLFKGGRFGINPYPKSVAFKFRRILKGWDNDDCWYPETAPIIVAGADTGYRVVAISVSGMSTPSGVTWVDTVIAPGGNHQIAWPDRYLRWSLSGNILYSFNAVDWITGAALPGGGSAERGCIFDECLLIPKGLAGYVLTDDGGETLETFAYPEYPRMSWLVAGPSAVMMTSHYQSRFWSTTGPRGPWVEGTIGHDLYAGHGIVGAYGDGQWMWASCDSPTGGSTPKIVAATSVDLFTDQTLPSTGAADHVTGIDYGNGYFLAVTNDNQLLRKPDSGPWELMTENPAATGVHNNLQFILGKFFWKFEEFTLTSVDGDVWVTDSIGGDPGPISAGPLIDTRAYSTLGMNPAHMILDSLISQDMQGEPWDNINEASFTAAADKLFDEGFGLITTYNHQAETSQQFQERILNVIGGALSQSRIDGKYRLDLIRGEYELEDLPILGDADILEYEREPSNPNDSVNEVVVEWFDPVKKEKRSTTPIQSLGAIQAAGAVISETAKYPEIPYEDLALRVAARDLKSKSSPLNRFKLTTTRKPFGWRSGTFFRLQVPRRGIADMVCMVGELSAGTLRSGAMTMVAIQDVTGMPATTYVVPEPGVDTEPDQTADPAPAQAAFEAPYVELAGALPIAEREAIGIDTGYLLGVAARPDTEINYGFMTRATGEDYAEASTGDWCPTALVVEAATIDPAEIDFTLDQALDLDRVAVGTAALWGSEICRVDAINPTALTVRLARACGDTVPQAHAADERIWFYDAWSAFDSRIYAEGETVQAKFLSRTSTQELTLYAAPTSTVVMDGRAMRPYPPGQFRLDGVYAPTTATGTPVVEWTHRDRLLQADQLVESEAASIGPEPTVRYGLRLLDDTDTLIIQRLDIAGDTASFVLDYTGDVTLELWSISDVGESWQRITRTFAYTPPGGVVVDTITAPTYTPGDEIIDGGEVTP